MMPFDGLGHACRTRSYSITPHTTRPASISSPCTPALFPVFSFLPPQLSQQSSGLGYGSWGWGAKGLMPSGLRRKRG